MTLRFQMLLLVWSLLTSSACCFAQELESFPDAALTTDQWQQRVQDARRRSEEFVANARTQTTDPLQSEKEEAEAADQRALNDPSLQKGDVVATSRGQVVFVGREGEEHQPGYFLPVPDRTYPAPLVTARER
jgi:hypothetical protein